MSHPISKVYGDGYVQRENSQGSLGKNAMISRAGKRRLYGFNLPADLTEEVSEEELSLALIGKGFCDYTTSHGVPHIYRASSGGKRILWLILSLLSIGALSYHLSQLISTYIKYDTSTDIKVNTTIRSLQFPAVTVCNNNMVRSSAISVALNNLVSTAASRNDKNQAKQDILNNLAYEYALMDNQDVKFDLGHQFEKMILFAGFNYEDVTADFVHFFNPYHGNCFTFNHFTDKNMSSSTRAGSEYGLWMRLNIEQYEYVPFLTEASGIKILIHDSKQMPFPEDGGVTVAPNTMTRLSVRKTEYSNLNGRYGDCLKEGKDEIPSTIYYYEYGYSYSKSACEQSCIQEHAVKECGCYVPQIPYNESFFTKTEAVPPCQHSGASADCMDYVYIDFAENTLPCKECKELCDGSVYDVIPSSTVWPAPTFMGDLKTEIEKDYSDVFADLKKNYQLHDTISVPIQENLLEVVIFYDKISVTQNIQEPKVTDFQFISDLGGSLGLWVGWSMLTIFEFFELAVDMLVLCLVKLKIRQDNNRTHPQRINVQEQTTLHTNKYT